MTVFIRPRVTADIGGTGTDIVKIDGGTVTLDALAVPYGAATIEVALDVVPELDDLDPRDDTRVIVTGTDAVAGQSRVFNLGLRGRTINHKAKTVSAELATDEAMLTDYMALATDTGARAAQASVRAVVNHVLAKIGASLAAGGPDADATAYWPVSNVLSNPAAELALAPWSANGNCTLFHAGIGLAGASSAGYNAQAAGLLALSPHVVGSGPSVTPGRSYVFSGYGLAYQTTPARTMRACIRWLNQAGTPVGPDVEGPDVALNAATWTRTWIGGTAPVGASKVEVFWRIAGSTAAGQIGYVDAAMFHEGAELVPYFDGSSADDAHYNYSWALAAHTSGSTRTPYVERQPDIYVWQPGTTAWDFLTPFTTTTGLRLFCDEQRVWRLVDPGDYSVPGVVTLAPYNTAEGADTIARGDAEVFATGVVVRYTWTDDDGIPHVAYDSAGDPSRGYVLDIASAYPGPGAAARILARRNGTGRTQDVTALPSWPATPGMEASITMPDTPRLAGRVSSVQFNLDDGALMTVGTRGLIDIIDGSIDALAGTIDALAGTIDAL